MKTVLVSSFFGTEARGGAAMSVQRLALGLASRGIPVVVIASHARRQITVEHLDRLTVYRFFPWNLYWVGDKNRQPIGKKVLWHLIDVWNVHTFWVIQHILQQERPHIVHVNKLRGLSPSVWAASRARSIEVVQTCHDYELMSPEGTLHGHLGTWAQQGAWFFQPYQGIRAACSKVVGAATAPSRYTLEQLTGHGFFPRAVKRVIPNSHGLTFERLGQLYQRIMARPIPDDKTVHMLYLGRLETTKGVELLCEAFSRCAAQFPNVSLDIAGWGTLESIFRQQHGRNKVTFHGPVFGESKAHLLERTDILIVPSVWLENSPIVIAEAYAYGKPVLATRTGGIPELIREGETGFLVPPGDTAALTEALCRIAEEPETVRRMASACFETAQQYALETIVNQYVSLYHQVQRREASTESCGGP